MFKSIVVRLLLAVALIAGTAPAFAQFWRDPWNGGTITNPLVLPDGSAGAPSLRFTGDTQSGWYQPAANQWSLSISGTPTWFYTNTLFRMGSGVSLAWDDGSNAVGGSSDVILVRDAANALALRNSTTGQAYRVYNTFTDGSNYERGVISWSANDLTVGVEIAGTGSTARQLHLKSASSGRVYLMNGASQRWFVESSGHFLSAADNTYDIGATGATRPRVVYAGTGMVTPTLQGNYTKTLTETSATGFVTLGVANSEVCAARVEYTVVARDATNTQAKSGQVFITAAATSGGVVTAATLSDVDTLNPVTSGTLTNTMTQTTAANSMTLLANATSSLTQTLLEIRYRVHIMSGTCAVTAL